MTEEQRRALFALREALRLCESAGLTICGTQDESVAVYDENAGHVCQILASDDCNLRVQDVDRILEANPE